MDSKWADRVKTWMGLAVTCGGLLLYNERRFGAIENHWAIQEEHAQDVQKRLGRIELDSAGRLALGADGGFARDDIRAMVARTVELETRKLHLVDIEYLQRAGADLERRIAEHITATVRDEFARQPNK